MTKNNKILRRIKDLVNNTAPDAEIFLFGSRARRDSKTQSDWDLLILLNLKDISFEFETKFMDAFYELEIETGEVISPLIYTKKEWNNKHSFTPLYENIQSEGVKL